MGTCDNEGATWYKRSNRGGLDEIGELSAEEGDGLIIEEFFAEVEEDI